MNIRFVSSLTSDDEDRVAPAVLSAIASLLDQTTIAYTLRIETSGHKTYEHHRPLAEVTANEMDENLFLKRSAGV